MNCQVLHERRIHIMGKSKNKRNKLEKSKKISAEQDNSNVNSNSLRESIVASVVAGLIVAVITVIGSYLIQTAVIGTKLDGAIEELASVKGEIENLQKSNQDIKEQIATLKTSYSELEKRIVRLEGVNDSLILKGMTNVSISFETNKVLSETYLTQPSWKKSDIIAVDLRTGKEYTSMELKDKKVLLTYEENSQEIFFYGQFNENNRWDKECLINVYKDGSLILIMEAIYSDGQLLNYKQIIPDTTSKGQDIWIVSERVVEDNSNVGVNQNYYREKIIKKEFLTENVQEEDLVTVEAFKMDMDSKLEGFYYGATSNGKYNDTTGNAYLAKYSKDGSIRTLYVGEFKNGVFDDEQAWYITREDTPGKETDYMYYEGAFHAGRPVSKEMQNNLSIEDIQNYISGYKFECVLRWYFNGDVLQSL